ncbi:HdeD family acid-resistance protein [Acidipropionibacterium jensenii]|uniref:Uncharacterized conserved protein n=1 Tax=Acidipropionibacterium jensenii TaxID=1749 RepID=A0A448P035_9ACTN|nr:DUF308 domain-containing protein [Acidipropionibacterium jensenii]MDN5978477.1 DUF308 domain-containing protein [Acidipropionibacterium jensenii]MDN5997454.1 DUF308 domain-containing protein [Acidipropionibacterium jensenii]MDN6426223.1 DUF308 domain-containing protein [Acidipropionibacterium jensenii]MDN6442800.1 DUF308 domain-containing protein [Acidipropionibacterium jensenii]MDN6479925.1 DUF308 domain-containing protein [Acidipropionibacterium jensenii]
MSETYTSGLGEGTRRFIAVAGLLAALSGVAILVWPGHAWKAITVVMAIYAVLAGLVYVIGAVVGKSLGTGGRIGHGLLGLLYVIAGCFAFGQLSRTAVFLALFVAVMIGVMWMMEGFVALFVLSTGESSAWNIIFAVISILAGISLVSSPLWGAVFLWWLLGISLVVLGLLNAFRAIFSKKKA